MKNWRTQDATDRAAAERLTGSSPWRQRYSWQDLAFFLSFLMLVAFALWAGFHHY
jgi:hypothetical protein